MSTHSLPTHLAEATALVTNPMELGIQSVIQTGQPARTRLVMLPADRMDTVKKSRANLAGNLTRTINKARDAIATNRSTRTLSSYQRRIKEALRIRDEFHIQVRADSIEEH